MKRTSLSLVAALFAAVLGGGVAAAEPAKNQVRASATCDDGRQYAFVLNGESNAGHLLDSTSNLITARYAVDYFDQEGNLVASDSFDQGAKKGQRLISCHGETAFEHWQLGTVTAVMEFQGFVTPNGKS